MTGVSGPARFRPSSTLLRRLAFASLAANIGIVLTGAAVRLTGSGLGCPTWPRCTDDSYTTTAEMGVHGAIEFGNRLLTMVLGAIALAGLVAALRHRPRRPALVWLSAAVLAGIAAQGVIGGISVRLKLNPWVVGLHFIVSVALITAAYALWRRVADGDGPVRPTVPAALRPLVGLTTLVSAAVIALGVVVTGSGPHSGDGGAARNGLDPQTVSQLHADLVFLLVGLSTGLWFAARALAASGLARAALVLVLVELGQGLIGFVQYFTGLPVLLVGAHMLGACLVWTATLATVWATRERVGAPSTVPAAPPLRVPAPTP
jgi:cytochrome c oxidase assembly protein subunit 15